jgi:hypothetical protein
MAHGAHEEPEEEEAAVYLFPLMNAASACRRSIFVRYRRPSMRAECLIRRGAIARCGLFIYAIGIIIPRRISAWKEVGARQLLAA